MSNPEHSYEMIRTDIISALAADGFSYLEAEDTVKRFERHVLARSEPSDAQIEAAWRTYENIPPETFVMGASIGKARERMRAALRAASEVGRSLAAFQQISDAQERLSAAVDESRWPCGCRYSIYELTHPDEGHVDGDHRPVGA